MYRLKMLTLYSFAEEMPEGQHNFERNKDRLSYTHQIVKIDLTQVKVSDVSFILFAIFIFKLEINDSFI